MNKTLQRYKLLTISLAISGCNRGFGQCNPHVQIIFSYDGILFQCSRDKFSRHSLLLSLHFSTQATRQTRALFKPTAITEE
jgi:hypothetical protein